MANELDAHFITVFMRENYSSFPIQKTNFNGSKPETLGQLIVDL